MSVSDFYIPPKEISFRLKNYLSKHVLYSKKGDFGHYDGAINDDQYWQLVPGTGEYDGYYLVKSKNTGEVLFSRTKRTPNVDTASGDGKWRDNYFKLEPGNGARANYFRLRNFDSDTVVFSRTEKKPQVGNFKADGDKFDDQYWAFEFEDMKFVSIDYKVDEQKILSSNPVSICSKTLTNVGNSADETLNQENTITLTETVTTTSIHEHTHGFSVKFGFKWALGPGEAMKFAEFSAEVTQSNEWKIGEHVATTKTFSDTPKLTAKPGTEVTAEITSTKNELEVPYTMVLKSASTGYEVKSSGRYQGVTYWDTKTIMRTKKISENRSLDEEEDEGEVEVIGEPTITTGTGEVAEEDRILEAENDEQNGDYIPEENEGTNAYTQDKEAPESNDYAQEEEAPEDDQTGEIAENDEYPQEEDVSQNEYAKVEAPENNEHTQDQETPDNNNEYTQDQDDPEDNEYAEDEQAPVNDESAEQEDPSEPNEYTPAEDVSKDNAYTQQGVGPEDEYAQTEEANQNDEYNQDENDYQNQYLRGEEPIENNDYARDEEPRQEEYGGDQSYDQEGYGQEAPVGYQESLNEQNSEREYARRGERYGREEADGYEQRY